MERHSNGFYTFSDSYLKSMKKQDLINYIRTIEKNWENQLITNDIQYSNCKRLLVEERTKVIDEFAERLKTKSYSGYATLEDYCEDTIESVAVEDICRIAEEMRGAE